MTTYRTYRQDIKDLERLGITAEEFDNVISYIYDKTADEMATIAKTIKAGGKVSELVRRAFERVLLIRKGERLEAFNIYFN